MWSVAHGLSLAKPFNNVENGMYLEGPTGISWHTMSKNCVVFSSNTQLYWTILRSDQQQSV